jgi:hypothetical protein
MPCRAINSVEDQPKEFDLIFHSKQILIFSHIINNWSPLLASQVLHSMCIDMDHNRFALSVIIFFWSALFYVL